MKASTTVKKLLVLIVLVMSAVSCKKELHEPTVPGVDSQATNPGLRKAQDLYAQKGYSITFYETYLKKQNLATTWEPQWEKARSAAKGPSVTYYYVPLKSPSKTPFTLKGIRPYLLIRVDSAETKFYRALYIADDAGGKQRLVEQTAATENVFLQQFTGILALKDLATATEKIVPYRNGLFVPDGASSVAPGGSKKTDKTLSCGYWTTCYWSAYCIAAGEPSTYGTITYSDPDGATSHSSCTPPLNTSPPTCALSGWQLTESTNVYQCIGELNSEFVPPPPPAAPYQTQDPVGPLDPNYAASLYNSLLNNPNALLLPCAGLTNDWIPIIQFHPPQAIRDKLDYLSSRGFISGMDQYYVQNLKDAFGPSINLDKHSIDFNQLPVINGQQLTMEQTLNYIRLNLSQYSGTNFDPQTQTGQNEGNLWYSNNPTGAVIRIDISLIDKGDVIVSNYNSSYNSVSWTFSTIHDPFSHDHPVSGTRVFGITQNPNGTYQFYTMGADRLTGLGDATMGEITNIRDNGQNPWQFDKGSQLWETLMGGLKGKLFDNQSIPSKINPAIDNHPDFDQLQYILRNNLPLSNLDY